MSVSAIDGVWKRSTAKGSNLLILLAIADYADDTGRDAWPSLKHLAAKSRMTERACRLILSKLVADQELQIEKNTDGREVGRGYVPPCFYHVLCCEKSSHDRKTFPRRAGENFSQKRIKGDLFRSSDALLTTSKDPSLEPEDLAAAEPPRPKTLIAEYVDRFVARVGLQPKIHGPKDGKIFKDLETQYADAGGRTFVVDCLDVFFAPGADPFFASAGYSVGVFSACFNKLVIQVARLQRGRKGDAEYTERRALLDAMRARAEQREQDARRAIVAMPAAAREALKALAIAEIGDAFRRTMKAEAFERAVKGGMVSVLIQYTDRVPGDRRLTVLEGAAAFVAEHGGAVLV